MFRLNENKSVKLCKFLIHIADLVNWTKQKKLDVSQNKTH